MRLWFGLRYVNNFEKSAFDLQAAHDLNPHRLEIVGYPTTLEEADKLMCDFLDKRHMRHDYWNVTFEERKGRLKEVTYDFGSWTRFFFLTGIDKKTSDKFFGITKGE